MPLAVGIRCIMCHEVAGEQHEASLHTAHTAAISDSVVAGHCVSPMSRAVIGHSFPESQETCTNKKSSGIKCAKSIMSVVCVCVLLGAFALFRPCVWPEEVPGRQKEVESPADHTVGLVLWEKILTSHVDSKVPSHVPESNIVEPSQQSFQMFPDSIQP